MTVDEMIKEKIRKREYYRKNKARMIAYHKEYEKTHRDVINRIHRKWLQKKKEEQKNVAEAKGNQV